MNLAGFRCAECHRVLRFNFQVWDYMTPLCLRCSLWILESQGAAFEAATTARLAGKLVPIEFKHSPSDAPVARNQGERLRVDGQHEPRDRGLAPRTTPLGERWSATWGFSIGSSIRTGGSPW